MEHEGPRHLQLVTPTPHEVGQLPLFSDDETNANRILGFFQMSQATAESFESMLTRFRPTWVFDLRSVPWFDFIRFSRLKAFSSFKQVGASYRDLMGRFQIDENHHTFISSGELSRRLSDDFKHSSPALLGPVIFLLDDVEILQTARRVLPKTLTPSPEEGWIPRALH
ncbi:MAG: hypothetical protein ACPG4T_18055 [Nannocystaceae bacterium]